MTTPAVIDPAAIDRISRYGGPDVVAQLIEIFARDLPLRLHAARTAAEAGDWTSFADALHSLKSTAGNLGATSLQQLAQELEAEARSHHRPPPADRLDQLDATFGQALAALRHLQEPSS